MIAEEVVARGGPRARRGQGRRGHWLNDAARDLVASCGGGWSGPGSPLGALATVRVGARRIPTRWASPSGGIRWWQVAATALDGGRTLYEITDETDRYDADGRDAGAVGRAVAVQPGGMDRQAGLVDLERRRRHRRVLRDARWRRSNGSPTCRTTGTGWSRDCTHDDRASSWRPSTARSRSGRGSPSWRAATSTGPGSSSGCSSGAARCSATPRAVPPGCWARSATSPSTTTTGPS